LNKQDLNNLIAMGEGFTAEYKRTGTSTRFCQVGFGFDEDLSKRCVGQLAVYVPMGVLMVERRASKSLEAA
jgi:hypothetical protein